MDFAKNQSDMPALYTKYGYLPTYFTLLNSLGVSTKLLISLMLVLVLFALWRNRRPRTLTSLRGAYVMVTGCDSGFGRELVKRLDMLGFRVIATCLNDEGCESLRQECNDSLYTITLNTADADSISRAVEEVNRIVPIEKGLWGLVNNAGTVGPMCPGIMTQTEDITRVVAINTIGPFTLTQGVVPLLRIARGRLVNTSSINGRIICSQFLPYSISKYGVEALSDILRRELGSVGIKVSIVEPGFFRTCILGDLSKNIRESYWNAPVHTREIFDTNYLDRLIRSFQANLIFASKNTHKVTDAYIDALTSVSPRTRYVVGWDAKLLFMPLSYMPSLIQDFVFCSLVELLKSWVDLFFSYKKKID